MQIAIFEIVVDRLINVALVLGLVYGFAVLHSRGESPSRSLPTYMVGERAPIVPGADYAKAERTVVLFLRSSCVFCQRSVPFYAKLIEARGRSKASLQLVAISLEDKLVLDQFLAEHKLAVDATATVTQADWEKVGSTPTVLVVDRSGSIQGTWTGQLSEDKEGDVLTAAGLASGWWPLSSW